MYTILKSIALLLTIGLVQVGLPNTSFAHDGDARDGDDRPVRNGDVNADGEIDIDDLIFLAKFLVGDGPPPVPIELPSDKPTTIYLVRHTEDDKSFPNRPLTEAGRARAQLLAENFRDAAVTHVFSSHKTRTLQTVEPTAAEHDLEVQQFPRPGSIGGGEKVTEGTSTSASIEPMLDALSEVPAGSVVVAAGHSSTLFAIMAGLGVRVGTEDDPCDEEDASCLPCVEKACFPGDQFDNLWVVALGQNSEAEAAMARLHYGDPCLQTMP